MKTNINWFRTKANARRGVLLKIIPHNGFLSLSNRIVSAKLNSFIKEPPIPNIPEMQGGTLIKIIDLKGMVNQIRAARGEIIKLSYSNYNLKP